MSKFFPLDTQGANLEKEPVKIALDRLQKHPHNPQIFMRDDVIEQIRGSLESGEFDQRYAIIVRPLSPFRIKWYDFEFISGHDRVEAARLANLNWVWAWIRETITEEISYLELFSSNTQSDLKPLEKGLHALGMVHAGMWGQSLAAYAQAVRRPEQSVRNEFNAAKVAVIVRGPVKSPHTCVAFHEPNENNSLLKDLIGYHRHLAEIHAAPEWLWPAMVEEMVSKEMTVAATRQMVSNLKEVEVGEDMDKADIAKRLVAGSLSPYEIKRMAEHKEAESVTETTEEPESEAETTDEPEKAKFAESANFHEGNENKETSSTPNQTPAGGPSATSSDVLQAIRSIRQRRAEKLKAEETEEPETKQEQADTAERLAALRANVSLKEWDDLGDEEKRALLDPNRIVHATTFNKKSDELEWAQFSWNPVTGCREGCAYCAARDIATDSSMKEIYPHGFEPAFRPNALLAPYKTKVPKQAEQDTRFKNVLTCTMADLFGEWVPKEWIEAVLRSVRENPQWNFLFLTRFPKRMIEFEIPENAWMGTTVDFQVRVKNAEEAFSKLNCNVKWLSIEPMLEPLEFKNLKAFDWIVIGGASKSSETPEWYPPFEWIGDLVFQAREAGIRVYFKTNLGIKNRLLELPFDTPIQGDHQAAPKVFNYLGK